MKCGFCETELEKDARFCHICGQPVPVDRSQGGFCPHCDTRLPATAVFCPHCGAKVAYSRLRRTEAAAAPAPVRTAAAPETGPAVPARAEQPAPAPEEEKKAKKTEKTARSNRAGLLLALVLVLLILGSLAAVAYVEAMVRGQALGDYVAALAPGGSEEATGRWSDLALAQGAESAEDAAAEQSLPEEYRLLLELLRSREDAIRRYDWQLESGESRPVVLCDVCGDSLPELIWVEETEAQNVRETRLQVATIRDGAAEIIYSRPWDIQAGGGFCYYLFQREGDKTLHCYAAWGEESWAEAYTALVEHEGELLPEELLMCVSSAEWEGDSVRETKRFSRGGVEVEENVWRAAVETLRGDTASVLMYNRYGGDFAMNRAAQQGCPAMTLDEALARLAAGPGTGD